MLVSGVINVNKNADGVYSLDLVGAKESLVNKNFEIKGALISFEVNYVDINNFDGFYVNAYKAGETKNIDYLAGVDVGDVIKINVLSMLDEGYTKILIDGGNYNSIIESNCTLYLDGEYYSLKEKDRVYDNYNLAEAGNLLLDINRGNILLSRKDIVLKGKKLSYSVGSIYNSKFNDDGSIVHNDGVVEYTNGSSVFGRKRRGTFEQKVIKNSSGYYYFDEEGMVHEFNVKYYAQVNGENIEVSEAEIYLNAEESLVCTIDDKEYNVEKVCKDEFGNSLFYEESHYKNFKYFGSQSDTAKKIEELEKSIADCEDELSNIEKEIDIHNSNLSVLKGEVVSDLGILNYNFYNISLPYLQADSSHASQISIPSGDLNSDSTLKSYKDVENDSTLTEEEKKMVAEKYKFNVILLNEKNSLLSLSSAKLECEKMIEAYKEILNLTKDNYPICAIETKEKRTLYFALIHNSVEHRLIGISKDDDMIYLHYDVNGLLDYVIDYSEKCLYFEYINGLVSKITNSSGDIVEYTYDENNNLTSVCVNGKYNSYEYDGSNNLVKVVRSNGKGVGLTHNVNSGKVVSVSEIVGTESRNEKIYTYSTYTTSIRNSYTGKVVTYIFSKDKKLETIYDNDFDSESIESNVRTVLYEYSKGKKCYSISSYEYAYNLLYNENFDGYDSSNSSEESMSTTTQIDPTIELMPGSSDSDGVDNRIYTVSNSLVMNVSTSTITRIKNENKCDFVLSGWAKADSNYIRNSRLSNYGDAIEISEFEQLLEDGMNLNSRFELRVVMGYEDGTSSTLYNSFNYLISGWQYNAIPVSIDETKLSSLSSIQIVFDYSNNNGTAKFYGIELREGNWEYREYDNKDKVTLVETRDSIHSYSYNRAELVEKIVSIDRFGNEITTTYKYDDKENLLVKESSLGIVDENIYDENNNLIKSKHYHKDYPCSSISDDYKDDDNVYNEFGKKVGSYILESDKVIGIKDNQGNIESYGFVDGVMTAVSSSVDGESNSNVSIYREDNLVSVLHNNTSVDYSYDIWGDLDGVTIGESPFVSITRERNVDLGVVVENYEYASQEKIIVTKDFEGKLQNVKYECDGASNTLYQCTYDNKGNIETVSGPSSSTSVVHDRLGELTGKIVSNGSDRLEIRNTTDKDENTFTSEIGVTIDGIVESSKYTYAHSKDGRNTLDTISVEKEEQNVLEQNMKYDYLGRLKKFVTNGDAHTYEYVTVGDRTSSLVASEIYSSEGKVKSKYNYIYDEYGNIVKVKEDGKLITRYTYDGLNRLVREDNKKLDSTVVYVYDIGGNIIRKEKYSYTLDEDLGDGVSSIYRYSDAGWNDLLVEYGDYTIEYDNLGKPKSHNGNTLEWSNVRQLTGYGSNIQYTYDMNGRRISKTVGEVTTKYFLDGDRILAQDDGNYMEFIYGISGVEGFILLDNVYRYKKNILGDIIGIIDEDNNEIVRYVYDAYGNHRIELLNGSDYIECDYDLDYTNNSILDSYRTISKENPFRYRGYYYDTETQLFYCNSRYYSPELCRWISPDSIEYLDPQSINGLNLYCYCMNNPIMYADPSGHFAITSFLIGLGISALIGAVAGGVSYAASELVSYAFTGEFSWSWASFAGSVLGGAIGGALAAIPGVNAMVVAGVSGFASTAIGMGLENAWEGKDYTFGQIMFVSTINGLISSAAGGLFEAIPIKGLTSGKGSYSAITKQITTKFFNGTIKRITYKTFLKMLRYDVLGGMIGAGVSGVMDATGANDWMANWFHQRTGF